MISGSIVSVIALMFCSSVIHPVNITVSKIPQSNQMRATEIISFPFFVLPEYQQIIIFIIWW